MKQIHQIRFFALIMMLSWFSLSVFAQIEPNAIYNYYTNDSFDAFLNIDVDSIKYSNIDIYGKEHNDIVTQEIWTQDSVYRIPLSSIDSICFRAPEIKLKDSVFFITAEHIPYIVNVDTLSLAFKPSIPAHLLPEVGQTVINDTFDEPLQDGFAGRVIAVNYTDDSVRVVCEDVTVFDIFERLSLVGKVVSASEEEVAKFHAQRAARASKGEHWWELYSDGGVFPVNLGKKKLSIFDGLFFISSDKIKGTCRWSIDVNPLSYTVNTDLTLNHPDIEYGVNCSFPKFWEDLSNLYHGETDKETLLDKIKIPIELVPGVLDLEIAPVVKTEGSIEISGKYNTAGVQRLSFVAIGTIVNPLPTLIPTKCKFDIVKKPEFEASLKFKESIDLGVEFRLVAKLLSQRMLKITGAVGYGLNASGQIELSTDMFEGGTLNPAFYNMLDNFKADLKAYVEGYVKAKVAGYSFLSSKLVQRWELPLQSVYLFPKFAAPKLNEYPNNQSMLPLAMSSDISRDLIFKCHPGLRVYNEDGLAVKEVMSPEAYRIEDLWKDRNLQLDLSTLPPGTYTCKPNFHYTNSIVNFDKRIEVPNVSSTIVVPETMSLSEQSVTMVENEAKTIEIRGGWGDYTIENSNNKAVTALVSPLVFTPGIHQLILKSGTKGNATLKITDIRTGIKKTLTVKVDPEADVPGSTITTDSYEISEDGTTLIRWLGDEKIINMSADPVLNRVSKIQSSAFANNQNITAIVIPPSVVEIGNTVFDNCTNLAIVKFQDGDKTLALGSDHIYSSSTGVGLFQDCHLQSVYIGRNLSYNTDWRAGYSPFHKNATLSKVIFGNNVTSDIANNMFLNCAALQSVTINDRIQNINNSAFNGCSSLIDVRLSQNLKKIGNSAFANCSNLPYITLPSHLEIIEGSAFANCSGLGQITFPPSVKEVGNTAFDNCALLALVVIQDGSEVLKLGSDHIYSSSTGVGLFQDCNLKAVYIGRNLEYNTDWRAGYSPFHKNATLSTVTISNNVTMDIPDNMFLNCAALQSVTISDQIQNINGSAFNGCSSLFNVHLPNNLKTIGNSTFANCRQLQSITFPNKLETINSSAFANCSSLESLTIPANVKEIGNTAFDNCGNLSRLIIRDGPETLKLGSDHIYSSSTGVGLFQDCRLEVAYIGRNLEYNTDWRAGYSPFHKNATLTSVTISNNVTMDIPDNMFLNCTALEKVVISNQIKNLKSSAFNGCSSLQEVSLPDNLVAIFGSTFANCTSLPDISFPGKLVTIGGSAFANCSNLGQLIIPSSVKEIGNTAFDNCASISRIIIKDCPDTLWLGSDHIYSSSTGVGLFQDCRLINVYIGRNLNYNKDWRAGYSPFHNNATLTNVRFSENVSMDIPDNMFLNCKALESVWFSDKIETISISVFNGCISLAKVKLPANLKTIGGSMFANCLGLTEVTLPEKLETIGGSAFANCSNLASITIPPSVREIGNSAFDNCGNLSKLIINDSPDTLWLGSDHIYSSSVGVGLFQDCRLQIAYIGRNLDYNKDWRAGYSPFHKNATLTSVRFSENVTMDIPDNMFLNCTALESVRFSNQTEKLNVSVFNGCTSLTRVFLPENLTSLGGSVFANCTSLAEITLPDQLEIIGGSAFANCSNLASMTIPPSVKEIGNSAFDNCGNLSKLIINDSPDTLWLGSDHIYSSSVGVGLFQDCRLQIAYIGRNLDYNKDWRAGYSPFHKNATLTSVRFSENVTMDIPDNMFLNCTALESVRFSNQTEKLNVSVFNGCTSLTNVFLPENLISLGGSVFANCTSLAEITLPDQLEIIGGSAFANCSNLASMTIPPSVKEIGNTAFDNCGNLAELIIQNGTDTLKLGSDHIYSSSTGVGLFHDCGLQSVYIGRNLSYNTDWRAGYSPFFNNPTLNSAELCNRFQSIPPNLFRNCGNLKNLTVRRSSPPEIGGGAFDGVPKADATLYVPRSGVSSYQSAEGWSDFGTITYIR